MQSSTVAGYKDLFPNGRRNYTSFVEAIPSDIVISVLIALNNELNSEEETFELQKRIFRALTKRFTDKQKEELAKTLNRFRAKTDDQYSGLIFGRRYLIATIIKELNNYRQCPNYIDNPIDEYHLFKAYLIVVDEVNQRDHRFIDFKKLDKTDPLSRYKLLWLPLINQWEWYERVNIIFETFKLLCFLKYVKVMYNDYLKEYLNGLDFKSIEQLLGSFNQVNKSTYVDDKDALLRKLAYIAPQPNVVQTHLRQQTINQRIGESEITISDVRKFPLYYKDGRGYMIIDNYTYHKKNYRGPFFELRLNTSLKDKESFNTYSTNISDELEKSCLSPILTLLSNSKADVLHFDDKTTSVPDGYVRIGNKIFLFEYKAYFFPETLTNYPEFDAIKKYIDERFVKSDRGKDKGITQLQTQIEILSKKGFEFDQDIRENTNEIKIYPILVHQDFQFSMPGVNYYLNELFKEKLKTMDTSFQIESVLLVNLEVLLDMAICGNDFTYLETSVQEYQRFLAEHTSKYQRNGEKDDFFKSHLSFDQLYNTKMIKKLDDPNSTIPHLDKLLEIAEISLDEFKEPI